MSKKDVIDRVIRIAEGEIGYLEKKSDALLESTTENAGSKNMTKYWRDVMPEFQGQPWCACFVSWCFMRAFGEEEAKRLLGHWPYVYCPTMASLFQGKKNPQRGDIVLFWRNGCYAHTGMIAEANGEYITVIEGNTSAEYGVIPNGGGVFRKTYRWTELENIRFCRPDYRTGMKVEENGGRKELSRIPYCRGTVTASALNVRRWAGAEYDRLKSVPCIYYGEEIQICDSIRALDGSEWYYAIVQNNVYGFVCAEYVKKSE